MPISYPFKTAYWRRSSSLSLLFLLFPIFFYAQSRSLTGLWVGSLSNDSTTVRRDQSFEIALTEYKGKVYGYSRSEFIVNDTLYYIVKRVKGTIEGDVCEVTDDEIISYNFRGRLDKKVKVISTFRRNQDDSTWHLDGKWKTNATKNYYSVSGKIGLSEEKDLSASKLFPHLEELDLANDVAFYRERQESVPQLRIVKPERADPQFARAALSNTPESMAIAVAEKQRADADPDLYIAPINDSLRQSGAPLPKTNTGNVALNGAVVNTKAPAVNLARSDENLYIAPVTESLKKPAAGVPKQATKNVTASATNVSANSPALSQANTKLPPKPVQQEEEDDNVVHIKPSFTREPATNNAVAKPAASTSNTVAVTNNPNPSNTGSQANAGRRPDVMEKASTVQGRKSEFAQEVFFKSDSLQIAIYDNGVVDGDTVSVFLNGEVIMSRQGLKESAIRKTIYINPNDEAFTLVLFADNLGLYPPNTGLLVVRDGNDVYNLRFSADFQKNAGVVFKRKR